MVCYASAGSLVSQLSCLAPSQPSDEEKNSLTLSPPIASIGMVEQSNNNSTCSSAELLNVVKDTLEQLVLGIIDTIVPCTLQMKRLVHHCPASSCTELFNLVQEERLILVSNYYWLLGTTGEVRKVYCNQNTQKPEYSSCEQLFLLGDLPSDTCIVRPSRGNPVTVLCDTDSVEGGGGRWTNVASSAASTTCGHR